MISTMRVLVTLVVATAALVASWTTQAALAQSTSSACPLASVQGNAVGPASPTTSAVFSSIAFVTGDGDLAVLSMSGANQRVLVPGPIHAPTWSHDARRLAYVREGGSKGDRVEVVNADGTGRAVVLPAQPNPLFQPPDPYTEPFIGIEQVRWSPTTPCSTLRPTSTTSSDTRYAVWISQRARCRM